MQIHAEGLPGSSRKLDRLRIFNEILFSISLPLSLGYGVLLYGSKQLIAAHNTPNHPFDFIYLWLRAAVRINNFLHLSRSTIGLRFPNPGSQIGIELAFVVPVICIGLILFALLRVVPRGLAYKGITKYVAGAFALFLLPGVLLWAESATRDSSGFRILCAEVFICLVLLLVSRRKPLSLQALLPLAFLHYGFWTIDHCRSVPGFSIYPVYVPWFATIFAAVQGIVCIVYWSGRAKTQAENGAERHAGLLTWLSAGLGVVLLVLLFRTRHGYELMRTRDRKNIEIVMQRTHCFGSCPVYEVKIRGNGSVEYNGLQFVSECGKRSSSISEPQVDEILRAFDKANFFALEDRAFLWGYDVPSVVVKITADGRARAIRAQDWEPENSEAQRGLLKAAAKVDEVVGTQKWVVRDYSNVCHEGRSTSVNSQ